MIPVSISAMTLTCAAGTGLGALRRALRGQRSGLRASDFPGCDLDTWIGRVDGVERTRLPAGLADRDCRNNRLALLGLEQDGFTERVAAVVRRYGAHRVACVLGTSTAGIGSTEAAYRARGADGRMPEAYRLPQVHTPHTSTAFVADLLGLAGPAFTISTACSSSAKVFAAGRRLLAADCADAVVVGGVDSLCLSVLYGFHSLELVSAHPCRPFDRKRDGINLGEAAGYAVLERGDRGDIRLLGVGESSDAWHMSSPHPEGRGASAAMTGAIADAGLQPPDIDYINLHGTATPMNDATEAGVVHTLFGAGVTASSTKAWTGHTLGAAGITEIVLAALALLDGLLPGTLNCRQPAAPADAFLLTTNRERRVNIVMSNSFGFGGSNCSVVLGRA